MDLLTVMLEPSGFAHALFLAGVFAAVLQRLRPLSWWLLAASGAVTLAFSSGVVAAALMSPLEYSRAGLDSAAAEPATRSVVVLTGWASDDPNLPLSARMNAASLYRVLYAFELHQRRPDGKVIVSGGETAARIMSDVLVELGVPREQVVVDDASVSTAASATALRGIVDDEAFLLVTSAGHMPRALGVMEKQGLKPIAAPTDYQLPKEWWKAEVRPSSFALTVSDLAAHEYLGLLWYRLRDLL